METQEEREAFLIKLLRFLTDIITNMYQSIVPRLLVIFL